MDSVYQMILDCVSTSAEILEKMTTDFKANEGSYHYDFTPEELKAMIVTLKFSMQILQESNSKSIYPNAELGNIFNN